MFTPFNLNASPLSLKLISATQTLKAELQTVFSSPCELRVIESRPKLCIINQACSRTAYKNAASFFNAEQLEKNETTLPLLTL